MRQTELTKDKFLNDAELVHLKCLLERDDSRDALFINLALNTGARASELLNLKLEDIDHNDRAVYIKGLKNSKDRLIPLKHDLYNRLYAYIERYCQADSKELVFKFSYDRLYQIWQNYKPGPKKFHSLRHTFAVELYKRRRDIKLVQTALGHKTINTTMIYMDYLYSIEELKKLILM